MPVGNIKLGDEAPDFTAETTEGKINLYEYLGDGWGVLFSHPKDYTPVCTTELGAVAKLKDEFAKRNAVAKSIGLPAAPDGFFFCGFGAGTSSTTPTNLT